MTRAALATAALTLGLYGLARPAPAPAAGEAKPGAAQQAVIQMQVGIPGAVWLGETLAELLARYPDARQAPFANQPQVLRLSIPSEGISALAMGETPAAMTIESIGFNFAEAYEGVPASTRRTVEGIGAGSNVNELLEIYGKPAESGPEDRRSPLMPAPPGAVAPSGRVRHVYRSADGTVTTYFVVEGSRVLRMAMNRPATIGRFILKPPAAAPPPSVK